MKSTNVSNISAVMLLGSLPPSPVGGTELQALKLCRSLKAEGVSVRIITWGKLWDKRGGEIDGIPYARISTVLNLVTDIPSLFKRYVAQTNEATVFDYDNSKTNTAEVTAKVSFAMVARYSLFYINALVYLWLRRKSFQILHVHMMEWPAFVGVKLGKALRKKVVIKDSTMNGITNVLRYPDGKKKQELILRNAYCVAMTKIIGENLLKAGINRSRLAYIPNGIDIRTKNKEGRPWTNSVIFVGNLYQQPAKGVDILLKAWKLVIEKIPSAFLRIVGDGNLDDYRSYARNNGIGNHVEFCGRQANVNDLLLRSDIFVLPSRREGMSNALMEAMMAGMPVIATDISGNQDLIKGGTSGLLVKPSDINGLALAIIDLLEHPGIAKRMGEEAYKAICDIADMKKVTRQYIDLYTRILEERSV